jgi:DNA ligase-1
VRYLVFDAPASPGGFEDRLGYLKDALASRNPKFARAHDHILCRDVESLRKELARVESLGGEGLMLRRPGSKYEAGRSATLVKVKSFHDAEAIIIGHQGGAGKHKGRLGALLMRLPTGVEFSVGTGFSDRERDNPPPVGATITFRYQELSEAGVPRFPSYVGIRADVPIARKANKIEPPIHPPTAPIAVSTPASSSASGAATSKPRYFEFRDPTSNKFWEISRDGSNMTTRWGRIGASGQSKTKSFADEAAAIKQVARLILEKTAEGYIEHST